MDLLPNKDANGPDLHDGKLKLLNACCVHFNKSKKGPNNTTIIQQLPLLVNNVSDQLFNIT